MVNLELCKWGYCINTGMESLSLPSGTTLGLGWWGVLLPLCVGLFLGSLIVYLYVSAKENYQQGANVLFLWLLVISLGFIALSSNSLMDSNQGLNNCESELHECKTKLLSPFPYEYIFKMLDYGGEEEGYLCKEYECSLHPYAGNHRRDDCMNTTGWVDCGTFYKALED